MGWSLGPIVAALVNPEVMRYLALGVLVAAILIGVGLIVAMRRERREQPLTDADLLAQFEEARASGEMDEAEFRRVSAVLTGRSSRARATPSPPASPVPPAQAPGGEDPAASGEPGPDASDHT